MGLQLLDHQPDLLSHRFLLVKNLIVPEPENTKTSFLQFLCAIFVILCLLSMLGPIHFNDQFVFQSDKIENVITKSVLTAKFQTTNLTTTQKMPQSLFRIRQVVAKRPLQFAGTYLLVCLADHNLPHPLPIPPLEE
jgi:hypothetical protein